MGMSAGGGGSIKAEPNVTPMIDVMLVLLIIFMIVVPQIAAGFKASPPKGQNIKAHPEDENADQVLGIDKEGQYFLNKKPINNADLETRIRGVFSKAGVRLSKVSKLEVSAKTKGMNAMLSPDGVGTEVIITDTLLEKIAPEGVEVVLAHELGHKVHRDVPVLVVMSAVQIMIMIAVAQWLFLSIGTQFGLQGAGDIATLPLMMLSFTAIGQLASLLINSYKRRMEYRADAYALEITQNQPAFEAAFRVLASENLVDPDPPRWVEIWLHDHPSIGKRLEAARAWRTA